MKERSSFWDRRRAGVQAEAEVELRAAQEALAAQRIEEMSEKDDCEILMEMGLPDPEAMQRGDDFAAFMARDVPERIRKKALRTLWRSNPVLACVDGLNDYDDDYRIGSTGNGPIKTAYQIGKGMMYHIEEMARQSAAKDEGEAVAAETEVEPVTVTAADQTPEEMPDETEGAQDAAAADVMAEGHMPTPRRMRFHFAEAGA